MNRRSFFRRTVGAAIAGFVAPLAVRKTGITHWILNPEWITATHEIQFDYGYCHLDGTPTRIPSQIIFKRNELS